MPNTLFLGFLFFLFFGFLFLFLFLHFRCNCDIYQNPILKYVSNYINLWELEVANKNIHVWKNPTYS